MAVTADQIITGRIPGTGRLGEGLVVASKTLYAGTIWFVDANGFITDVIAAGVNTLAGIGRKQVDNSAGSSGDLKCEYYSGITAVLPLPSAAQADVGSLVYAVDNYVLSLTATNQTLVGVITRFVGTGLVEVQLDRRVA